MFFIGAEARPIIYVIYMKREKPNSEEIDGEGEL